MNDESIESFLLRQDAATLACVLLELAQNHDSVKARLERLQLAEQPKKLAASFRKTLTSLRRSTKYISYREEAAFGRTLTAWLDDVYRELAPRDSIAALALFESFIEGDERLIERVDGSSGIIGDVMRCACQHWLQTAAQCAAKASQPSKSWSERLMHLVGQDQYGTRDELLRSADLLLDETAMRELVAQFESRIRRVLDSGSSKKALPTEVFSYSAALSLLAQALRDPDVQVRGVLCHSPHPNPLQRQSFVEAYLQAGRPSDALAWLEPGWEHLERTRQGLLSDALGQLGRYSESALIRQQLFVQTLAVSDLHRWLEHLPEMSRSEAKQRAHQWALSHHDPETAATVLLDIGDDEAAEAMLLANPEKVRGDHYSSLLPLAQAFDVHRRKRGEALIYRVLMADILDRASSKSYGYAARYWARLQEIAASGASMIPLESHTAFAAMIQLKHGRKPAFWAHVEGKRRQ